MRRKVLQDHTNTLCQMLFGWRMGEDVHRFATLGSGTLFIDVRDGKCAHNDKPVHGIYTAGELRVWFWDQLHKHSIHPGDIVAAHNIADIDVVSQKSRKRIPKIHLQWDMICRIATDEKEYVGRLKESMTWAGAI